uniref:Uncharacterized protein n=1 Tax=Rhizophagus irregularis (strain DAOM 181602 / DAOM 197198 / MUCL 43194) TaxID=747089 RepID=U9UU77_RHIID
MDFVWMFDHRFLWKLCTNFVKHFLGILKHLEIRSGTVFGIVQRYLRLLSLLKTVLALTFRLRL